MKLCIYGSVPHQTASNAVAYIHIIAAPETGWTGHHDEIEVDDKKAFFAKCKTLFKYGYSSQYDELQIFTKHDWSFVKDKLMRLNLELPIFD